MCRSLAEGGRRCPSDLHHQGHSHSKENQAARQQLSRARRRLKDAKAAGDAARIAKVEAQVAAAQARVNASKPADAAPAPAAVHVVEKTRTGIPAHTPAVMAGAPASAPATTDPAPSQNRPGGDLESRITDAYQELAVKPQDWVSLSRLREKLGNPDDAEMKKILLAMAKTGNVHLAPQSNRRTLTEADHAAALRIGTQDKHLIAIEPEYFHTRTPGTDPQTDAATAPKSVLGPPSTIAVPATDRSAAVATHLQQASTREEAAAALAGLTKKELVQVAESLGTRLRAGKKADQVGQLIENAVGARLKHEAILGGPWKQASRTKPGASRQYRAGGDPAQ